jgi:hypothetical protein
MLNYFEHPFYISCGLSISGKALQASGLVYNPVRPGPSTSQGWCVEEPSTGNFVCLMTEHNITHLLALLLLEYTLYTALRQEGKTENFSQIYESRSQRHGDTTTLTRLEISMAVSVMYMVYADICVTPTRYSVLMTLCGTRSMEWTQPCTMCMMGHLRRVSSPSSTVVRCLPPLY